MSGVECNEMFEDEGVTYLSRRGPRLPRNEPSRAGRSASDGYARASRSPALAGSHGSASRGAASNAPFVPAGIARRTRCTACRRIAKRLCPAAYYKRQSIFYFDKCCFQMNYLLFRRRSINTS